MEGSFEPIADWWDAHAGDAGDFFHQHLTLPALFAALGDVAGLPVLDLGCGNITQWTKIRNRVLDWLRRVVHNDRPAS